MKYLVVLLILISPVAHGHDAKCERDMNRLNFLSDPRLNWSTWKALKDTHRLPPPFFGLAGLFASFMKELPSGMAPGEKAFFNGVVETLRDRARVYDLSKDIEDELEGAQDPRAKFLDLLASYEHRFGLKNVEVDHILSPSELHAILKQGATFTDQIGHTLSLVNNDQLPGAAHPQQGQWTHERLTHRRQVLLILRDVLARPEVYGNPTPQHVLEYYKKLGDEDFLAHLDWSATSSTKDPLGSNSRDLFFQLFDTQENNGSSPGFYTEYSSYFPLIPLF